MTSSELSNSELFQQVLIAFAVVFIVVSVGIDTLKTQKKNLRERWKEDCKEHFNGSYSSNLNNSNMCVPECVGPDGSVYHPSTRNWCNAGIKDPNYIGLLMDLASYLGGSSEKKPETK